MTPLKYLGGAVAAAGLAATLGSWVTSADLPTWFEYALVALAVGLAVAALMLFVIGVAGLLTDPASEESARDPLFSLRLPAQPQIGHLGNHRTVYFDQALVTNHSGKKRALRFELSMPGLQFLDSGEFQAVYQEDPAIRARYLSNPLDLPTNRQGTLAFILRSGPIGDVETFGLSIYDSGGRRSYAVSKLGEHTFYSDGSVGTGGSDRVSEQRRGRIWSRWILEHFTLAPVMGLGTVAVIATFMIVSVLGLGDGPSTAPTTQPTAAGVEATTSLVRQAARSADPTSVSVTSVATSIPASASTAAAALTTAATTEGPATTSSTEDSADQIGDERIWLFVESGDVVIGNDYDEWGFEGGGSDVVTVEAAGGLGGGLESLKVEVFQDLTGSRLATSGCQAGVAYALNFELPASGTYTARITSCYGSTGTYSVEVLRK
jgi:hypothetical protein